MKNHTLHSLILVWIVRILMVGMVVFVCFSLPGVWAETAEDEVEGNIGSVSRMQKNFHIVEPGLWRSSQPSEESILRMKAYGLKTIVNLRRGGKDHRWEKDLAGKLGIQYFHFPMNSSKKQEPAYLREILSVITNPDNRPVLVHCHAGKDRAGLVIALFKKEYGGESLEDIRLEMLMYGYDEPSYPTIIQTVREWGSSGQPN